MLVSDKEMAPQVLGTPRDRAHRKVGTLLWTLESSAPHAHPSIEEQNQPDEAPHVCNDGWVTIGHIVADPETGEEVEEYALYLCRRCNA